MHRFVVVGIVSVFIGSASLSLADPMDEVVQALIQESSEPSLENVESTLLKLGPTAIDSLVRLLASTDNALRLTAVRVLGKMGRIAEQKLFQALQDDQWKVRVGAASALAHHTSEVVVKHLIAVLKDTHPAVRSASTRALGRIGNTKATGSLIFMLQDSKQVVRKNAAKALGRVRDHRATRPLVAALQDDEDSVRREAIAALAQIGQPAVEPLSAIVADGSRDPSSRQVAALTLRAIAEVGRADSVSDGAFSLGIGLRDEHVGVRQASADALVMIGQSAVEVVRTALLQDENPEVRAEAATIFGRSASATTWYAEAVDALILALDDQEEDVRAMVRNALVRIHAITFPQLVDALKDSSPVRRKGAIAVLGRIGHRGAIKPLETLLATEPDSAVRKSIVSALEILRAKPVAKTPPLRQIESR